ncbi:hypothetical protein ABLN87_21455 [Ruegeria sp. SCPT10]|uniref:hypothetical protein n=1 Tax=Ruegeria sp. SCP10 TaxID=3141377 RepID=UPI00333BF275
MKSVIIDENNMPSCGIVRSDVIRNSSGVEAIRIRGAEILADMHRRMVQSVSEEKNKGYTAGFQEGFGVLSSIIQEYEDALQKLGEQVDDLLYNSLSNLLGSVADKDLFAVSVGNALEELRTGSDIQIFASAEDVESVKLAIDLSSLSEAIKTKITIVSDNQVKEGECRICTADEVVVTSVTIMVANIFASLESSKFTTTILK